jgi:hypothetical protein
MRPPVIPNQGSRYFTWPGSKGGDAGVAGLPVHWTASIPVVSVAMCLSSALCFRLKIQAHFLSETYY